jgi:hypothetical protein
MARRSRCTAARSSSSKMNATVVLAADAGAYVVERELATPTGGEEPARPTARRRQNRTPVRFLADMGVSTSTVRSLRANGHDARATSVRKESP